MDQEQQQQGEEQEAQQAIEQDKLKVEMEKKKVAEEQKRLEDERKALTGFPGAVRVPILKQLFSNNDQTIGATDVVILLTPHIVYEPETCKEGDKAACEAHRRHAVVDELVRVTFFQQVSTQSLYPVQQTSFSHVSQTRRQVVTRMLQNLKTAYIRIDDDGLVRQLVTAEGVDEAAIADNRQNRTVPVEISVLAVGYQQGGRITHLLPPRPPLSLDVITLCDDDELRRFTSTGHFGYFRHVLRNSELPAGEVLAAHLRQVPSDAKYYGVTFDEQKNPKADEVAQAAKSVVWIRVQLC